jgi:cholesterol transport system auxiliary component
MSRLFALSFALLLSACGSLQSIGQKPAPPALFDLGPASTAPALSVELNLQDVAAPTWLAGTGIAYRLTYADAFRREIYRDSRWAAPPAALLAERLRQRAAAGRTAAAKAVAMRLELEEFSQSFTSPAQSSVTVRLRAWRGDAQMRVFEVTRPAASADAAGAVRGLSAAADAVIDELLAWAAQ